MRSTDTGKKECLNVFGRVRGDFREDKLLG